MTKKTTAIIVAAGSGQRYGKKLPKQFQEIGGKPLIYHTLKKFETADSINNIVVVAGKDWMSFITREIEETYEFNKITRIIEGGKERQESVYNGLVALQNETDFVAVHDVVRPLVTVSKINEAVAACHKHSAVILAIPPIDTIKQAENGIVVQTLDRSSLWSVQTPQVFKYDLLVQAHQNARKIKLAKTDDSGLVELLGHPVRIIPGDYENFKITVPADLKLAELLLKEN